MGLTLIVITAVILSGGVISSVAYDLCIIGAGLFGSAAARYASANPGLKICLIGLEEPKTVNEMKKRDIFGAHYDQSRIVETFHNMLEIQTLARNSIKSYRELEKLSGVSFYNPLGVLCIGKKFSEWMENNEQAACRSKHVCLADLSFGDVLQKRFPYMKIKSDEYALFDDSGAGYINPRKMIAAQKKVAEMQGCSIITDVVEEVKECYTGYHEITTGSHGKIYSKRVLFTTGAFTNFKKFHPLPKLQIRLFKETVALLRISEDEARRLSSMPPMIYNSEEHNFNAYILPSVEYPDGFNYLKIGSLRGFPEPQELHDLEGVKNWYLGNGDQNVIDRASKFLMKMLPSMKVEKISGFSCVVSITPSGLPYIDRISPTVTVAVGGNGDGAAMSEEVGRIAAHLSLTGKWDSELPKRLFNAIPS